MNYNAGCKTAASNIIMSIAVMLTLLFLTPLFHYTPLVVLSAIIVSAMLGLIDYEAAIHLWKVDKFDFVVCMSAYLGVVFGSVEIGLIIAVCFSELPPHCGEFCVTHSVINIKIYELNMRFHVDVYIFRSQYLYFEYFYSLQGQGHSFWETSQILGYTEMSSNIQMQNMFLES